MAFVFQIVDSDDNLLFDLNDPTGATNTGSLQTQVLDESFSLGGPDPNHVFFEATGPGGTLARKRHGLVEMSWLQSVSASSADNLHAGVGEMTRLLDAGGILKWQPDGATEARWIDFLGSSIPQLLRGQELGAWKTYGLLDDIEGMPISVVRQPYLRGPEVTVGPTTVPNDPADVGGRVLSVTVSGDAPTPMKLTVTNPSATRDLVNFHVARMSGDSVTDYATEKHFQLESGTLGTNTSSVADANASGGNTAEITFGSAGLITRSTVTVAPAAMDSLIGRTFDIYVRAAGTGSQTNTMQVTYYLAGSTAAGGLGITEPVIDIDNTFTTEYRDIKLGRIHVPDYASLSGLVFEVAASRETGTFNLRLDFLILVPVGESMSIGWAQLGAEQDESFYSDPETGLFETLNSSGALVGRLPALHGPVPIWGMPGANRLYFAFGSGGGGTTDSPAFTRLDHDCSVTLTYSPRYWQ